MTEVVVVGRLNEIRDALVQAVAGQRISVDLAWAVIHEWDALLARVASLENALRQELWMNHGCDYSAMYGDDGEMQCANGRPYHLPLDFKRDPIEELQEAVMLARAARGSEAFAVLSGVPAADEGGGS